tara:strand:- start:705 stop:1199 length:495 start_codon:yes stop_codon:yes gene_type:complete
MALTRVIGDGIGQVTDIKLGGSGSANTLDDYEEGTWTPVLSVGSGTAPSASGTISGKYTKIGNLVNFHFDIVNITAGNTSNQAVRISSLPFTSATGDTYFSVVIDNITLQGSRTNAVGVVSGANNYAFLLAYGIVGGDATDTPIDNGDLNSGSADISGSGFYYT